MGSSLNDISSLCKSKVEGEVLGSRPTRCIYNMGFFQSLVVESYLFQRDDDR